MAFFWLSKENFRVLSIALIGVYLFMNQIIQIPGEQVFFKTAQNSPLKKGKDSMSNKNLRKKGLSNAFILLI